MKKIMHVIFFVIVLLITTGKSQAQHIKIDSLQKALKAANHDTIRATIYVALSEELYLFNIDTVLPLCFKAIQIVDSKINNANVAEKKSFLISKSSALNNIGYVYKQKGDIAKSLEWYNKGLKIREEIGNRYGIANSINNIGRIYNMQGDNRKAIECYNKSLSIQNEIGDKQGASISLNNIGLIYNNQGDIIKAIEYYNKGLKIQNEIGDKQGVGISLHNIGNIYNTHGDFQKAFVSYHKSLKILEEIGDKKGIAVLLNSLGILYKDQGDISKALEYFSKSLKIREEIGDKDGIAGSFNNIASIYDKQAEHEKNPDSINSKFNSALEWNKKCLLIWKEMGDKQGIATSFYNMSGIYLRQANSQQDKNRAGLLLKKAEEFCRISLKSYKELEYPVNIRNASERLSIIYTKMGESAFNFGNMKVSAQKYKDANEMQNLFKFTADKINDVEMQKSILKKQMQFEFEKIENTTKAEQEKKDSIAQEEKQRQKLFLWSVIGGLLFAIVLAGFVFRSLRITRRQKNIIELQKNEMSHQKEIVEKQNEKIIDSITYAKRIQQSILIEEYEIQNYLPDSFIYYQPKDIVSGDFYWCSKIDDKIILAAVDCTGHGVPGAFMSMIGNTLLNQIVNEKHITEPSEILRWLNLGVYEALHQEKDGALSDDGMDIAICSIDYKLNELQYAGAQNPLYVISGNQIVVIKADIHGIGGGGMIAKIIDPIKKKYTNHVIPLKKDMSIYLFSDGYNDQFGGSERRKFGTQKFKELLLNIQQQKMQEQKKLIVAAHEDWKANRQQIDDILVIGIKI